jgi:methionine-rich copper-binding protein CopC
MSAVSRHIALTVALLVLLALPSAVAAHAEFVSGIPESGATVTAGPIDIVATFSEELGPKSNMRLLDDAGDVVANAAIDGKEMRIGLERIEPGSYQVRWTTVTTDDNGVERGSWTFNVTAPIPTKVVQTTAPSPTAAPSSSSAPSAVPSASPIPSASRGPSSPAGASSGDVVLPIVAALIVVALLGLILFRRRMPTRP